MKTAIVTGANGFIGSALCRELSIQNYHVIAVVHNRWSVTERISNIPNLSIIYCDLSQYVRLPELVSIKEIDVFFHLAWMGSAGILRGDSNVQVLNIKYACDAIRACSDMKCKRFVFASSIMKYELKAMLMEGRIPEISALYSSAKMTAECMLQIEADHLKVECVIANISNIYGPGENSQRLINTSIRKLIKGEYCMFSSGEQIYDFIYIDDAVRAFVAIGENGKAGKEYYIGSLEPRPLKEFLIEMKEIVAPEAEIGLGELPFNGVSLTYREFDIYAVKKDTLFEPEISFGEGIRRTLVWIQNNMV